MKFHFISSNTSEAIKAKEEYIKSYNQTDPDLADILIPIGDDGILLISLHDFNELNKWNFLFQKKTKKKEQN